ncbi:MAG TPA: hypothetical protein VGP47_02945 [Parachlamydiaceae bacterium]|nr:hypothetical protein [Parachlamydiaceae bacterium]
MSSAPSMFGFSIQPNITTLNNGLFNNNSIKADSGKIDYNERLKQIVHPIMEEIKYPRICTTRLLFSKPIDPTLAWATSFAVNVCPLFLIKLSEIPQEIRPEGWDDPRLCNLDFLQKLSDWIAEDCDIPRQKVTFIEAAAAKTIIKLKQDPQGIKALRAGIVHELGHVALGHCFSNEKHSKLKEKEADIYAAQHLQDGLEGIKIGFDAWQKSLQAVRSDSSFDWKTRLLMKFVITPGGNLWPLYFSHGFFETRIQQAEDAVKK